MLPYGRILVGEVNLRVTMSYVNTLILLFARDIVKSAVQSSAQLLNIFHNAAAHMQIVNYLYYKVTHFLGDSRHRP